MIKVLISEEKGSKGILLLFTCQHEELHSKEKLQKMVHFMTLAPRKITVVFVLYDLIYSKEKWHAGVNYDLNVKEKL